MTRFRSPFSYTRWDAAGESVGSTTDGSALPTHAWGEFTNGFTGLSARLLPARHIRPESKVPLPPSLGWILTVAFTCSGGWFLYHCARSAPDITDRLSLLLHALMCVAMVAMVWRWGTRVPHWPQVAVLGSSGLWFLTLAVRARRMRHAITNAHHALMAFVMVWMVTAPMPMRGHAGTPAYGGHAAMAEMTGPPPAAVTFAAYFLIVTLVWLAEAMTAPGPQRSLRRLSGTAVHAVMSVGTAVLTLAMSWGP